MPLPHFTRPSGMLCCLLILTFGISVGQGMHPRNQQPQTPPEFVPLENLLKQDLKLLDKNFTVLVFDRDKVVYKKEMGESKANMPVPIGRCSEWLTAALVLRMAEQGKISLDDKVSRYLPIFATYGKKYITIRECLTHYTGIAAPSVSAFHLGSYSSLEEEVNDLASKREIQTNPGTECRYSGVGFLIAGRVLEVAAKKPFDRLIKETLFRPLAMQRATFSSERAVDPEDGASCTPAELVNFFQMLLDTGNFKGKQVLSAASVAELLKDQVPKDSIRDVPKGADGFDLGLGSWVESTDPLVLCAPSFGGSWAYVDMHKAYGALILVDKPVGDPRRAVFQGIQSAIDGAMQPGH